MEKSYALVLPDGTHALREVMRVFAEKGVSVARASYSRVVDEHTLFLDVDAPGASLLAAEEELLARRLFPGQRPVGEARLLELSLTNEVGAMDQALELVDGLDLRVTYLDARSDGVGGNVVRLGVFVTDAARLDSLLNDLRALCPVRLVTREDTPEMLDNSHFCLSFARGLARRLSLSLTDEEEILINSNRIMQNLIREGADPYRPFDLIGQVARTFVAYSGRAFAEACRVTRFRTAGGVAGLCVEPPVGCTTWVLECDGCLLCVDTGYCCFAPQLLEVLRAHCPQWDKGPRVLVLTHGDMDHVGACDAFDEVYASGRTIDGFAFERMGVANWREQNPLSLPYNRIGGVLSGYRTPAYDGMRCLGEQSPFGTQDELLRRIDTLSVPPFSFEVWEGRGGHVRGETVLVDRAQRVCVSGDLFVNVHGETKPQARFNALAPVLMTSVDTDPDLARAERTALFELLGPGIWQLLGGHGRLYTREG